MALGQDRELESESKLADSLSTQFFLLLSKPSLPKGDGC